MARMLSEIERRAIRGAVIGCVTLLAAVTWAEEEKIQVSTPAPAVVVNPFSKDKAPQSNLPAAESDATASKPVKTSGVYRNPFAPGASAPPIAIQPMPGPVSRWQRSVAPFEEQSHVRTAILSADPTHERDASWNEVPPVEKMRDRAKRDQLGAAGAFRKSPVPPDPVQFAPTPLEQPVWLEAATKAAASDALEKANQKDETDVESPEVWAEGPSLGTPQGEQIDPVIVSDIDETPEGWLSQAQQLAGRAASLDELATVARLCERGLEATPRGEVATSLRELAAWAHNRRGESLADEGDATKSLEEFQRAIALDPNCALAFHNRAVSFAQQGDHLAALRDFNRVIELNPGLAMAYRNRAELYGQLGRMKEAVADYTRALDAMPEDADLYSARAYAWQRTGNFEQAQADLDRVLALRPDDAHALAQRGNLAAECDDYYRAIEAFEQAIAADPMCAEAYRGLAWVRSTCSAERYRDPEAAIEAAAKARQLAQPDDFLVLEALAAAHASAGDFAPAVRYQQKACEHASFEFVEPAQERLALYRSHQAFYSEGRSAVRPAAAESISGPRRSPAVRTR